MSIFRSEKMGLYHIAMSKESAYEVLSELGDQGYVQFIDQNPSESHFSRAFSKQIKRCEEIEAKIQIIINQSNVYGAEITPQKDIDGYLNNLRQNLESRGKAPHTYLDDIEEEIEQKQAQLSEQIVNYEKFQEQVIQLNEYKAVLEQCKQTLSEHLYGKQQYNLAEDEEDNDGVLADVGFGLNYMAGVIETKDLLRFKRMVFRATRSNSWTSSADIAPITIQKGNNQGDSLDDPSEGKVVEQTEVPRKASFLVIYQGGQNDTLKNKLTRIADSFGAARYPLPAKPSLFMKKVMEIEGQILEQSNTMKMTSRTIENMVREWSTSKGKGQCSWIEELRLFVVREKSLYTNMNLLKIKNEIFEGHYWAPEVQSRDIDTVIRNLHNRRINLPQTTIVAKDFKSQTPPTYFQTNEFTGVFQQIVDTYGIARYQEINPGIFCVAMFPIKFGIMFGDIGHGGLLFCAGICLTYFSDSLKANGMEQFAEVRYLFLLMGLFAFYCGFIYNDFFSLPWKLFGTCFENVEGSAVTKAIPDCVHPLGLDPKWYIAKNELSFMNSLKMKVAVIIGVIQMLWGIFLKGLNHLHRSEWIDFFFEFVPQITFLICTFGYMDFLIFKKWATPFEDTSRAPSIISQMINMPLKLGSTDGFPLFEDADAQESLQANLLYVALICVPMMLIPKPLILFCKSKSRADNKQQIEDLQVKLLDDKEEELKQNLKDQKAQSGGHGHGHDDEEFDMGEVGVHQIIETIEFVLGSISNTASYLRLWALSLAHGQLAKVFFEKTIGGGIQSGNIIAIFIGWFLFVNITLGVIMAMDLMECFLHALRLQWVEFQNKFYKADGYKFQPFSFKSALKNTGEAN